MRERRVVALRDVGRGEVEPAAPREGAADGMPMRRESLLLRVRSKRG
jgi:hypothetical protein